MSYIEKDIKIIEDPNYIAHSLLLIDLINNKKYDDALNIFEEKFIVPLYIHDGNKSIKQVENYVLKTMLVNSNYEKDFNFLNKIINKLSHENKEFFYLEIIRLELENIKNEFFYLEKNISIEIIREYLNNWDSDIILKPVENLLIFKEKEYLNQTTELQEGKIVKKI
jgi:hypothetical protein